MKYLFCLLIPIGVSLLIICLKSILRFAKNEIIYEMPYKNKTGTFTLETDGTYGLWLHGKLWTKPPLGEFGFNITHQQTGKKIPLSITFLRRSVNGIKTGRIELYSFHAEKGTYVISLDGETSHRDKISAIIRNMINKQSVDDSLYSIQIRHHTPEYVLLICIFGMIFGFMATLLGIILPIILP